MTLRDGKRERGRQRKRETEKDRAADYPIILTILGSWVRRLTIVGFLDSKTKGK